MALALAAFPLCAESRWQPSDAGANRLSFESRGAGDLTVYGDREQWFDAVASTPFVQEDFSAGFTRPDQVNVCFQAVGSRADDRCFGPGQLVRGFSMRSSRGSIFDENTLDVDLVTLGPSILGTPTNVVGNNLSDPPWNPTRIDFTDGPTVVALDVYDGLTGGSVLIQVYDTADALIGDFTVNPTMVNTPAFAGFTSPVPVRRIDVNAIDSGGAELIGHLAFGGGAGRIAAQDSSLDLGAFALGERAVAQARLVNAGHLDQRVPAIRAPAAPFQLIHDECSGAVLSPSASCVMMLAAQPDHEGLQIDHWLPAGEDGPPIALRAQAMAPRAVTVPGHVDFGDIAVGQGSATQRVLVANLSLADLVLDDGFSVSAPFQLVGGSCLDPDVVLIAGDSCELDIAFQPVSAGLFDADVAMSGAGQSLGRISVAGRAVTGGGQ